MSGCSRADCILQLVDLSVADHLMPILKPSVRPLAMKRAYVLSGCDSAVDHANTSRVVQTSLRHACGWTLE